ncbi:hypothetical protein D3OALGB2SA_3583 [Olavius algarvensis associated proteobacterium Delta 3]|nr:hypothetical protein D3OALGB2SA_3583 [Olavius algarvensis associated proteobacterium Delta 3]
MRLASCILHPASVSTTPSLHYFDFPKDPYPASSIQNPVSRIQKSGHFRARDNAAIGPGMML